eukprot:CAMPEP_0117870730 /NCGR_PEP_ID=MMETSP0950-20121206/10032_1 /TAXON_ID=44440 /ORGANISM="Chattonella subsalsa, Strain CCMP2191" /LENGTH=118 /DNA_ID=CAMNT_0005723109 /DNA_START=320 /DNA_END=676 /DNA_ORIENTATION=-
MKKKKKVERAMKAKRQTKLSKDVQLKANKKSQKSIKQNFQQQKTQPVMKLSGSTVLSSLPFRKQSDPASYYCYACGGTCKYGQPVKVPPFSGRGQVVKVSPFSEIPQLQINQINGTTS